MSGAEGSSRQYFSGNVDSAGKPCGIGRMRVRQNRVVLTVVATVKPVVEVSASPTGRTASSICEAREARGNSAPGRARH